MVSGIMTNQSKWGLLKALDSRYIYGRVPLLHAIIFLIEIAVTMRLIAKFNTYYAQNPGGIADTVAQSISAISVRCKELPKHRDTTSFISIDLQDLEKEKPPAVGELNFYRKRPAPFDFERLTRFMAYGFFMAPVQHRWFKFLSHIFPVTQAHATVPALKRVAMDQLIFAPIGLACFFTFMTVAEGGGRRALSRKFEDVYLPTLKANFVLWPAVQIMNFRLIPIQFQIPFVSSIGIAWTAYLSLTNSSEEE
ncbi:Protein required for ethanol metabolism [Microsporum ferrugineum]